MLYQVVTGEIREGDVSRWIDKTLTPVNPFWIGKNASDVEFLLWYILSKKTLLFKDFVLTCTKTAPRKIQLRQISAS